MLPMPKIAIWVAGDNSVDKIWKSIVHYFTKDKETEIKLFKVLGISGVFISLFSGIQSITSGVSVSGGIINFLAATVSALLMWFVDKTHKYVVGYVLTELGVFMALFAVLYFDMGGLSGSMTYFFSFGLVFSFLMFRGKLLVLMETLQVGFYLSIMLYSVKYPESVTPFADYKTQLIDQMVGIILSGVGIGLIFMIYIFQLEKVQKLAEEASQSKSRFLANMSHELRTPINMMLGINEMIARESSEETIKEYTRKATAAGNQLMSEVNQLLEFSKIDAGRVMLRRTPYNLFELINSFKDFFSKEAKIKGIELCAEIDERIVPDMQGDVQKITQIITNLLSNAIKYTFEGSVTLIVKQLKLTDTAQTLYFEVKDTGVGIKGEEISRIFDIFERADIENNRSIEGTGLGLAIAQNFAVALGGKIEVTSKYGVGSSFSLTIEQQLNKGLAPEEASETNVSLVAPKAKILAVDDNEMNLDVVKSLLKRTLINVSTAASGFECIEMMSKEKFNLVLLDIMMPGMNGMEALEEIRKLDNGSVPVIALTADAMQGRRESLLEAGFDGYLSKPIDFLELEKVIFDNLPTDLTEESDDYRENAGAKAFVESVIEEIRAYDVDVTDGLKHFCNDLFQYMNIVKIFIKGSAKVFEELDRLYAAGDYEGLTYKVHSLKGNAGNVGAKELKETSLKLEEHLRNKDYAYYEAGKVFLMFMLGRVLEGLNLLVLRYEQSGLTAQNEDTKAASSGFVDFKSGLLAALEYIEKGEQSPAVKTVEKLISMASPNDVSTLNEAKEDILEIEFDAAEGRIKDLLSRYE